MPPQDKRHFSETVPRDVLSNLPENVIDEILMRLPLQDATRTSILSHKWRYNWCRLPQLKLDNILWKTAEDLESPIIGFTNIMYHLMGFHVGPVTKFTLSIANLGDCPKIDSLLSFLSRNGIQDLVLQLSKDNPYKLPYSFFTCSQMRHLALQNCSFHPPPAFKEFQRLVSLELSNVTISSKVLGNLISGSPLLEQLVLRNILILEHIEINAPKLRSFEFIGRIEYILLMKAPLLVKLSLRNTSASSMNVRRNDLANYFESFPALEHLHLNYYTLQFLIAGLGDMPAKLLVPLNCLKCLQLSDICLDNFAQLSYALCLIRSSPYLQVIQMKVIVFTKPLPSNGVIVDEIPVSDVILNNLRAVKLEGITGARPQMELIKLFLAKSPMLLRMVIQPKLGNGSLETRVLAKMIKFPRASTKAEVDYEVETNSV